MLRCWALAALAVASLGACSKPVAISNDVDPSAPATVFVLGEKVAEGRGARIELKLPASYTKTEADGSHTTACLLDCDWEGPSSALTVRLQTRCGPVDYCVDSRAESVAAIAGFDKDARRGLLRGRIRAPFVSCTPEVYRLWIDNRGGTAVRVVAGNAARDVAAGATTRFDVAAPPCAGMGRVSVDGQDVGELPTVPDGLDFQAYGKAARDFLIDPSGARCYRGTKFYYASSSDSASGPESHDYVRAKLHALTWQIDNFLVEAPESVEAPIIDTRTQLVEFACAGGPVAGP
jgi:hypothetical protein